MLGQLIHGVGVVFLLIGAGMVLALNQLAGWIPLTGLGLVVVGLILVRLPLPWYYDMRHERTQLDHLDDD